MKAMQIDRYGEPGELYLADVPVPAVAPGSVLLMLEPRRAD